MEKKLVIEVAGWVKGSGYNFSQVVEQIDLTDEVENIDWETIIGLDDVFPEQWESDYEDEDYEWTAKIVVYDDNDDIIEERLLERVWESDVVNEWRADHEY